MQQQDGLPFLLTTLVGFPPNFEGEPCHCLSYHTPVKYCSGSRSEMIEHRPLVMRQSLSQSEAFLPLSPEHSQPIRGFPTIEPGMLLSSLQNHVKRGVCAPQGQS